MSNFITKAVEKHGNQYDYSKVVYVNSLTKVTIGCNEHGEFEQQPAAHVRGQGCPVCAKEARREKIVTRNQEGAKDQNSFLERAFEKHGERYDYSKAVFKGIRYNVTIICKEHGEFTQMAQAHIHNGQGCRLCYLEERRFIENFGETANKIHGDRYEYHKVDFMNKVDNSVIIVCKIHGDFYCRPADHIHPRKLQGCRQCSLGATSIQENLWLDRMGVNSLDRNVPLSIGGRTIRVDGYIPETNTVYEFLGDYWHGNPMNHNQLKLNQQCNKTFGQLYQETLDRFNQIQEAGYTLVYIWEKDWKDGVQNC